MWLVTKNSFVSVVAHRQRPNDVLVRARRKKDLVRLFPKKVKFIFTDKQADYHYRLILSKAELSKTVTDYIMQQLTYDNFKAAQDPDSQSWTDFLHGIWHLGYHMQHS